MADDDKKTHGAPIKIGSKANESVSCAQCAKQILGKEAYTYKGDKNTPIYLCDACRSKVEEALQKETENPNNVMAVILGAVAGVAGGILWYFFSMVTGYQIGYIAIGVGFLIGWGVVFGSGKKRGFGLQLISAAITTVTLFVSEYFMVLHYYRQYLLENKMEYPDYHGEMFLLSPFDPAVLQDLISPMGLLIWGIGIYFAYSIPKSRL